MIKKRNGAFVSYEKEKVENAIIKAMIETTKGADTELAEKIAKDLFTHSDANSVEQIQDLIEELLAANGRFDVAKTFTLYRSERERARGAASHPYKLLSKDFLSKYKHITPPMTELGEAVFYRTYSRFLQKENRREYWWETVARAVDYNCSLANTSVSEAEELFDNVFNLKQFLSGRTFWVGGTEVAYQYPMANYNCSFQILNDFQAFVEVFYLLMIGSGAGVRMLKEDVKSIPRVRTDVVVRHLNYAPVAKDDRVDHTSLEFDNDSVIISIGDSKEGWVQALKYYFEIMSAHEFRKIEQIMFSYNNIRPQGEKLKTFGGTASGHGALLQMFDKIHKTLIKYESPHKLKPIDCLDIANIIGEGVVVGGVRRTSEIALMDVDDEEIINAKSELYQYVNGSWNVNKEILHRQMSNNSIYFKKKPSRERLHWLIEKQRYSGEPGFINEEAGSKRRSNFNGVNP